MPLCTKSASLAAPMPCPVVFRIIAFGLWSVCCCCPGFAQTIDRIDCVDLAPGKTAQLTIYGNKLAAPVLLWTPFGTFAATAVDAKTSDTKAKCSVAVPNDQPPGRYEVRVLAGTSLSDSRFVLVDDLPFHDETKLSHDKSAPTTMPTACCVTGHLPPVRSTFFRFQLTQGQPVSFEVYARRLDSLLDPVLTLRDPNGNEVGFTDDTPGLSGDAFLRVQPALDGEYTLELRDVEYSGGAGHFFHFRVGQMPLVQAVFPRRTSSGKINFVAQGLADVVADVDFDDSKQATMQPAVLPSAAGSGLANFELTEQPPVLEIEPNDNLATAMDVTGKHLVAGRIQTSGDEDWYKISSDSKQHLCVTTHTRQLGSPVDVVLELYDSKGRKLRQVDDVQPLDAQLSMLLPRPGDYFFRVRELTQSGGPFWTYDLEIEFGGRLELSTSVEHLSVPAGGVSVVPVSVKRHGVAEPLELAFKVLSPAVNSLPVIVQSNQNTAFVTVGVTGQTTESAISQLRLVGQLPSGYEIPVHFRRDPKKGLQHKLLRPETRLFLSRGPVASFSVHSNVAAVKLSVGGEIRIPLTVVRKDNWDHPIQVESAIPKAELPAGISVQTINLKAEAGELILAAEDQTKPGRYSISLSCTSKKDKTVVVQPVPTITVDVE